MGARRLEVFGAFAVRLWPALRPPLPLPVPLPPLPPRQVLPPLRPGQRGPPLQRWSIYCTHASRRAATKALIAVGMLRASKPPPPLPCPSPLTLVGIGGKVGLVNLVGVCLRGAEGPVARRNGFHEETNGIGGHAKAFVDGAGVKETRFWRDQGPCVIEKHAEYRRVLSNLSLYHI
jgi:hypothetical protein